MFIFATGNNKSIDMDKRYKPTVRGKLYLVWFKMISRCTNHRDNMYKNYGKRGISVCKEWADSFPSFYLWAMESGYSPELSLDRIDVDGNYSPENCRWITMKEQQLNKQDTIYIHFHNTKIPLKLLIDKFGLHYSDVFDFLLKQEHLRKTK